MNRAMLVAIALLLALCGCQAKLESNVHANTMSSPSPKPTTSSPAVAPVDCYHATAPGLAKLEARIGPVRVEEQPEAAAKDDNPDKLWMVYGVVKDAPPNWCAGWGRTLAAAVREADHRCTKEYAVMMEARLRQGSHETDSDKLAAERRLPKYQKMLAAQKEQCGADQ